MDVVDKIKAVPTGAAGPFAGDVPRKPVVITSAKLVQ
jgi:peptidyl-prolyl cis-trans isomerase A (cyclophilin A)